MTPKEREAWNSRPVYTRTLTHCETCQDLKEDVEQRNHYWPNVAAVCCRGCFLNLIEAAKAPA